LIHRVPIYAPAITIIAFKIRLKSERYENNPLILKEYLFNINYYNIYDIFLDIFNGY